MPGKKKKNTKSKGSKAAPAEKSEPKQETPVAIVEEKAEPHPDSHDKKNPHNFHKNPVFDLLHTTHLKNICPSSQEVHTLKSTDSIEKAVTMFQEHKFLSAPVVDAKSGACLGFIDMLDITNYIIACAPDPDQIYADELGSLTIAGRAMSLVPCVRAIGMSRKNPYVAINGENPASEGCTLFSQGIHRFAVTDNDEKIVGLCAQLDLVKFVAKTLHMGHLKEMGEKTLSSFGYERMEVFSISDRATVLSALRKMAITGVSALAVVDSRTRRLCGNFSASDLKGLYKTKLPELTKTVREFLDAHSPASLNPICGNPDATLLENVKLLTESNLHHVWVIDDDMFPMGMISLSDICRIFANYTPA